MVTSQWEQPPHSSVGELINKMHTMKYDVVVRSTEFHIYTTTWVDIKNIALIMKRRGKICRITSCIN